MYRNIFLATLLGLLMAVPVSSKAPDNWNTQLKVLHQIHPWADKRVAWLGDSITDPNNKGSHLKYWHYLQQWLGITPYVYGISGNQWSDIPAQLHRLQAEHGQDVDAIVIMVGTNDFNAGTPIGHWYDEHRAIVEASQGLPRQRVVRMQRTLSLDPNTCKGRINIALDTLKRAYPTKQIVLLTPIHRGFAEFGRNNLQPDESYTNDCGEYISAYVEAVKEAGDVWAVPVIDLFADSGLYPLHKQALQYFHDAKTDQLHPSDTGHERIARTLVYRLLSLPCF